VFRQHERAAIDSDQEAFAPQSQVAFAQKKRKLSQLDEKKKIVSPLDKV